MMADTILVVHFLIAAFIVLGLLAVWDALRGGSHPEGFIAHWVRALLFYEAPAWVFTAAYLAWTAATLVTLRLVPPRRRAG
jgi:hypothetical protein